MVVALLIIIAILLIVLLISLAYNFIQKGRSRKASRSRQSGKINIEREKKEIVENLIEKWRDENKKTRKHFEKRRKTRSDKGKRRGAPSPDGKYTGAKVGKPKGSPGGGWERPPESEVDKEIDLYLKKCPRCGSEDLGNPVNDWPHYMADITPIKRGRQLIITKYIIHRYRCKECKNLVHVEFGALKNCHFGFGFISTVMQSRIGARHSYSVILEQLNHWIPEWDRFISPTTIVNWFKKYGETLEGFYLECVERLKEAEFVHADETGLPMQGKNWWLWVITTTIFTLFIPSATRGHEAIEEFFEDFEGVLISDFWGAYNNLTEEQQKCLAHLIKDLKMAVAQSEASMKKIDKRLEKDTELQEQKQEGEKKRGRGRPKKEPEPLSEEERAQLRAKREHEAQKYRHALKLYRFFKQAWDSEDNPLSYKAPEGVRATEEEAVELMKDIIAEIKSSGELSDVIRRLLKRLSKYEEYLFTYLTHPGIPPDNNPAERALRHFVIMRKISHNFNSSEVMDSFTLYLSFYQTCKQNGVDFGKALNSVLSGETESVLKAMGIV